MTKESLPIIPIGLNIFPYQVISLFIFFWAILRYLKIGEANFKLSELDPWIISFLLVFLIGLARGILLGHKPINIFLDFSVLLGYLAYFLPRVIKNPGAFIKKMLIALMVSGAFVGFIYVLILFFSILIRVATRQANMALISYIIALNALILIKDSRILRGISFIVIGFSLAAVGVSLQRALWVVTPLATLLVFVIWGYKGYLSRRLTLLLSVGIVLTIIPFYFLLYKSSLFWYGFLLSKRIGSLAKPIAVIPSLKLRLIQHEIVLERISNTFLFGSGLGDRLWLSFSQIVSPIVDNSIDCFLWKTGIIGATVFVLLIAKSLWMAWKVTMKSKERNVEWFSSSVFVGLLSLFLASLTTSFFFGYRFIFIIGLFLGFLSYEYDKIKTKEWKSPESD